MKIEGLTDFQNNLLRVEKYAQPVFKEAMKTSGNKALRIVRKKAKSLVKQKTGNYHKKFKRGKVFVDPSGDIAVRVLNTSPHGHLIEDGHRNVVNPGKGKGNGRGVKPGRGIGKEVGFTPGKKVIEKGIEEFAQNREDVKEIAKALDKLLSKNKL